MVENFKKCTKCEAGFMVGSGEYLSSLPPQYANYCVACGGFKLLDKPYGSPEDILMMKIIIKTGFEKVNTDA